MDTQYHFPVMFGEVIEHLQVKENGTYIDCTLGDGGHTLGILKRGGKVLGIDVDASALERAVKRIESAGFISSFTPVLGNFRNVDELAKLNGVEEIDGIVYDLGYSSYQLGAEHLGISFLEDQILDMRLDKSLQVTAADLVNAMSERELAEMFYKYSDERLARKFAKAIVQHRNLKKFHTTKDLADLIVSVAPPGYEHRRIHPATRVFQALRIAVNDEIENLKVSLPRAAHMLLPGGRMVVISFHSLEDKTVKEFGQSARPTLKEVVRKPLVPGDTEIAENNRSRSAKLRVFEKTENDQNTA
jgi:16S rRNA (cytosine1402-N4)-methyltransferase